MDFKQYAAVISVWVLAHPALAIVIFLAIANVMMAQIPKPKSPGWLAVYNLANKLLLIIATHKDDPGTFTLPWVIKILPELLPKPPPDSTEKTDPAPAAPPLVDSQPPPASKDDGEDHGS